jgi:hypothetical protein
MDCVRFPDIAMSILLFIITPRVDKKPARSLAAWVTKVELNILAHYRTAIHM